MTEKEEIIKSSQRLLSRLQPSIVEVIALNESAAFVSRTTLFPYKCVVVGQLQLAEHGYSVRQIIDTIECVARISVLKHEFTIALGAICNVDLNAIVDHYKPTTSATEQEENTMSIKMTLNTHCTKCYKPEVTIRNGRIWTRVCACRQPKEGPVCLPRDVKPQGILLSFNGPISDVYAELSKVEMKLASHERVINSIKQAVKNV